MCEQCGVMVEQYDAARGVAQSCVVFSWYENQGADPSDYGHERPAHGVVRTANDRIQRYHEAHPGVGLTRDELLAGIVD